MSSVKLFLDIDTDELAEMIFGYADQEDMLDLIFKIDETCNDWDFTEKLYQRFKELHDEYQSLEAEEADMLNEQGKYRA